MLNPSLGRKSLKRALKPLNPSPKVKGKLAYPLRREWLKWKQNFDACVESSSQLVGV